MTQPNRTPAPDTCTSPSWVRTVWDALHGAEYDYTSGSLRRAIVLLAVPMVLEMAMESIFAVCDVYFVSRLGDAATGSPGTSRVPCSRPPGRVGMGGRTPGHVPGDPGRLLVQQRQSLPVGASQFRRALVPGQLYRLPPGPAPMSAGSPSG